MESILYNDDYNIKYNTNKLIYQIEFSLSSPILINSIIKTKLILGATRDEEYKIINFKAYSVKSLRQFLKENNYQKTNSTALLINSLTKQLDYLITKENNTILGYSLENTIVINENKFIFIGPDLLKDINDKEEILVCKPFTKNDFFLSPELEKINSLPTYIHYKTAYFSLAYIALTILIGINDYQKENYASLLLLLDNHSCKYTKLYWLLSRCLIEEPKQRSILLI